MVIKIRRNNPFDETFKNEYISQDDEILYDSNTIQYIVCGIDCPIRIKEYAQFLECNILENSKITIDGGGARFINTEFRGELEVINDGEVEVYSEEIYDTANLKTDSTASTIEML